MSSIESGGIHGIVTASRAQEQSLLPSIKEHTSIKTIAAYFTEISFPLYLLMAIKIVCLSCPQIGSKWNQSVLSAKPQPNLDGISKKILLTLLDDLCWSMIGCSAEIVNRKDPLQGALMASARRLLLHISAKKLTESESGWTLFNLLFPPRFCTTWAFLDPKLFSACTANPLQTEVRTLLLLSADKP